MPFIDVVFCKLSTPPRDSISPALKFYNITRGRCPYKIRGGGREWVVVGFNSCCNLIICQHFFLSIFNAIVCKNNSRLGNYQINLKFYSYLPRLPYPLIKRVETLWRLIQQCIFRCKRFCCVIAVKTYIT